jgi:AcrR family transcriptional regulator
MVTRSTRAKPVRDSEAMRERILAAVGTMIVRDGLAAIGVNALAREVGCDKVLIYRYFGDLEGVYDAFAARSNFWWTVEELTAGIDPAKMSVTDALKLILRRHALGIRARPVTLAVFAAEGVERTPLVIALESVREKRSLELVEWIAPRFRLPKHLDFPVISLLLGTAVNNLAVRARKIRVMGGVTIKSDADWERILAAVDVLIDGMMKG